MTDNVADRLPIDGAWRVVPGVHRDHRGSFDAWFDGAAVAGQAGHRFPVAQANCSVSRRNVIRGIHFAASPPGQAKYVTCVRGAVFDVVVDVRLGSPSYGRWEHFYLDDRERAAVYIAEGLGHAFMALTDEAIVVYLCSAPHDPGRQQGLNPLDPGLGIRWPGAGSAVVSRRDAAAPTLREAERAGLLPRYQTERG
jgi:dTDP-4-dehydrorhamnose 3,5-epimerase